MEATASLAKPSAERVLFVEHSTVSITHDVTTENGMLPAGSEGAVVHVYRSGVDYEIEFVEPFAAVVTLRADELTQ